MVRLFQTLFVAILFAGFVGIGETQAQPRYIQEQLLINIGGERVPVTIYHTVISVEDKQPLKSGSNLKVRTSYTLTPGNPEIPEKGVTKVEVELSATMILEVMINPNGKIISIKNT